MSNMSYCRFRNTSNDLRDCESALDELLDGDVNNRESDLPLSHEELDAAKRLVRTCIQIAVRVAEDLNIDDIDGLDDASERDKVDALLDTANEELAGALAELEADDDEDGDEDDDPPVDEDEPTLGTDVGEVAVGDEAQQAAEVEALKPTPSDDQQSDEELLIVELVNSVNDADSWTGTLALFFKQNDDIEDEARQLIREELRIQGHSIIGGGAAPCYELRRVTTPTTNTETVATLFRRAFPEITLTIRNAETIPSESECGRDCAAAIRDGQAFAAHTSAAFANTSNVAQLVADVCGVYING